MGVGDYMNDRRDEGNVGGEDTAVSGRAEDRALAEDVRAASDATRPVSAVSRRRSRCCRNVSSAPNAAHNPSR
jgi:hypothetical protein